MITFTNVIMPFVVVGGLIALFIYVLVRDVREKGWWKALDPLVALAFKGVIMVVMVGLIIAAIAMVKAYGSAIVGVVLIPFVWLADTISGLSAVVVLLIIIAVLLFAILGKLDKGRSS